MNLETIQILLERLPTFKCVIVLIISKERTFKKPKKNLDSKDAHQRKYLTITETKS